MQVRVWQSFSCNNSGSYYVVARFGAPEKAAESAKELTAYFAQHAKEVDSMWDDDLDPTSTPAPADTALAEKHGFEWSGFLLWGDESAEGDEPDAIAIGRDVVIYHSYCGGFETAPLDKYFDAVGGKLGEEVDGEPPLSMMLDVPRAATSQTAARKLVAFFSQRAQEWVEVNDLEVSPPWGSSATENTGIEDEGFAYFFDGASLGAVIDVQLGGVSEIGAWLTANGISDFRFGIDVEGDSDRFRRIAAASCPECKNDQIRFLEAIRSGAPEDQIACDSCGGMFPLTDFPLPDDDA